MKDYYFSQIEFMSPEYDLSVKLRDQLLRKPLNLEFTTDQLESEIHEFHFGIFDFDLCLLGCLCLKPLDKLTIKMRQVAVRQSLQGKGIGSFLVLESEQWLLANNYRHITLHARDTAVSFYKRMNYITEGKQFIEVNIPHYAMKKDLIQNSI